MKTKEELSTLKAEFDAMKRKLSKLSEDELKLVVGGGPTSSERLAMDMWNQMINQHDMPKKNPDEKYVMSGNGEKN